MREGKIIFVSDKAREILASRGITLDEAPSARTAAAEKMSALESLQIYLRFRQRVFSSAVEANEAEHHELRLMNAVNRELWS